MLTDGAERRAEQGARWTRASAEVFPVHRATREPGGTGHWGIAGRRVKLTLFDANRSCRRPYAGFLGDSAQQLSRPCGRKPGFWITQTVALFFAIYAPLGAFF